LAPKKLKQEIEDTIGVQVGVDQFKIEEDAAIYDRFVLNIAERSGLGTQISA
jgi:hypothetical protein